MKYIMLLFVFTSWHDGLETTTSYSARGYPDMVACERHLASLRRQIGDTAEVTNADCFVGIR